jgi:hypothetical protein
VVVVYYAACSAEARKQALPGPRLLRGRRGAEKAACRCAVWACEGAQGSARECARGGPEHGGELGRGIGWETKARARRAAAAEKLRLLREGPT